MAPLLRQEVEGLHVHDVNYVRSLNNNEWNQINIDLLDIYFKLLNILELIYRNTTPLRLSSRLRGHTQFRISSNRYQSIYNIVGVIFHSNVQ